MVLSDDLKKLLQDPTKAKTLTTVDAEGNPHSVGIASFQVLEDGNIAFLELLDTCTTQRNLLNCYWFKKGVSIVAVGDWTKGECYQIKGRPYKFLTEGPLWDAYLDQIWKMIPEADPAGVWIITPEEVRNQNYFVRRQGEEERRANWKTWLTFKGARG